jgi:hypothetical protein
MYKEQVTDLFEEASALNTDSAIFDLKKRILQEYVQLDVSANILWFELQTPEFRSFLEKYCKQHIPDQSTFIENIICLSAMKKPWNT